jgi:hypothetical protein
MENVYYYVEQSCQGKDSGIVLLHMAIFFCPVVQHRVTKMAGEYWNRFSSLTISIFWSDMNICCVCMRLIFYNKCSISSLRQ